MGDASDAGDGNVYASSFINHIPKFRSPPKPHKLTRHRPTGPKSMRNGGGNNNRTRDKRMLGHLAKAMDRSNDSVLHRVRPQNGNERINTHARAPPTGPRQQGPGGRGGPRTLNSRMNTNMGGMGAMNMQQNPAGAINNMTQQQQLALYAMLEQQSQLMAQVLGSQQQMPMGRGGPMSMGNGGPNGYQQHQQGGRSLFDRVPANSQRPSNNGFRNGPQAGKFGGRGQQHADAAPPSSMDVEMSQDQKERDPEHTTCKWNLSCTNKDCKFAHQSPVAPAGTVIDYEDTCSFGAACKNFKCTGKHPSPAQKVAYQTTTECRFGALCTNTKCPFVHPTMPLCRNGADCTTPNCKFTHTKTECKFNPCLNPKCPFKHVEGQKRGKFDDKVWTAGDDKTEHVSERKFVDENAPEELIVPGAPGEEVSQAQASASTAELVT